VPQALWGGERLSGEGGGETPCGGERNSLEGGEALWGERVTLWGGRETLRGG